VSEESQGEWHRVASVGEVPEEDVIRVEIGERGIALYNVKGRFFASDDLCTHEKARLSDGFVVGDVIECPLHQGRFHIPSGNAKGAPVTVNLCTHPVRIADGQIYVQLNRRG